MNLDDEESLDTVLNKTSLIHQARNVIASSLSLSLRAPTCRGSQSQASTVPPRLFRVTKAVSQRLIAVAEFTSASGPRDCLRIRGVKESLPYVLSKAKDLEMVNTTTASF